MATLLRPHPSSATPGNIRDTVERAVTALFNWRESKSKTQKPQLLEEDEFMYLVLTLKKIPSKARINPYKISIPCPFHSAQDSSELCLIIDDRPASKLTSKDAKKKIKAEDIPIGKVLKLSKLKSDYKPFEAKRKLCDSYNMFFVDKRVVHLLPKLLGKKFFKKKKIPMPLDLTHKNWKEQIERACSSALLYLRTGTCCVLKVGKVSMETGEIVDNVVAALDGVIEILPGKWAGVRSFHLKFSDSVALPVYQTLPDLKLKIDGVKNNKQAIKEDGGGGDELDAKRDENLGKKSVSKKGRIHEVRYMDTEVDEDELGSSDGGDDFDSEKSENEKLGGADSDGKKRKKEDSMGGQVLTELNGKKLSKKSARLGNGEVRNDEKDILPLKHGEESAARKEEKKKKKKGGLVKLKDEVINVGIKKNKNKKSVR